MSGAKLLDLGLKNAYDEMFMDDAGRVENRGKKIYDIPLSEIDDFPDHPYQVRMDEDMKVLLESIQERGIITPVTLRRKEDGQYETISGHRRRKACELLGLTTIPAEIQELTRDEAVVLMVDSNIQRTTILPSEKAKAYKMRLDAMKRQAGRPSKENLRPVGANLIGIRSDEILASESTDSARQIQRYIRLTELIPPLLQLVDEKKIALRPAVELSYLTPEEQTGLLETIASEEATPSLAQAIKMREFSQNGKLNGDVILSIMCEEKPNQREKLTLRTERFRSYLPQGITPRQTEDYILKALEYYQRYRERQRQRDLER